MAAARPNSVCLALGVAILGGVVGMSPGAAFAQFFGPVAGELSETVYVDKVDAAVRTHLEQVETYLGGQQWEEAVETLRQLQQSHGSKVVNLTPSRYVNLRDFCHLRILQMGPQGLALYRQRVDPTAEAWYRKAVQSRDAASLRQVVDELFCSSWTDQALFALGELALEAGDYDAARRHWERIVPSPPADQPTLRLAIPDTDLSLTDVRARLVLASILEGSAERAAGELEAFDHLHPGAEGQLAGRKVAYAPVLRSLLEASGEWPRTDAAAPWTTFAGSPARQTSLPKLAVIGNLEWRQPLEAPPALDASVARNLGFRPRRVAEDNDLPLSYHPVVYRNLVLVAGPTGIAAFDLETGKPAWRNPIFSDVEGVIGRQRIINRSSVGAPRYTLTVHGHRLFARMGSAITSQASESLSSGAPGYVVCLDLEQQGKEMWRKSPQEDDWSFDGTPVADDERVYVAMRRTDVRPQAHVACFDAESGRTLWSQKVSAAESPARGQFDEITHNLLTLERDALYFNTNLGTVASLDARDGRIRWITQYRRNTHSDLSRPAAQFYRDLTPAVFAHGRLYVAPSDSSSILSLEAATGQVLWETQHADDAIHLLGVAGGRLLASGDRLWWIDAETGEAVHRWPDGPSPRGFGRGLLAGDQVFFPCREEIFVFDQRTGRPAAPIPLTAQFEGINGGHLVMADDFLVLATANRLRGHELVVFSPYSRLRKKLRDELTANPRAALPHVRLAKCEAALDNVDGAVELFEQAKTLAAGQRGLEAALLQQLIRGQLFELRMRQAAGLVAKNDWGTALSQYEQALGAAATAAGRLEALLAAAGAAQRAGQPDEAGRFYRAVLDDSALRALTVVHDPGWTTEAGAWAQTNIERLGTPAALLDSPAASNPFARLASYAAPLETKPQRSAESAALCLPLIRRAEQTWPAALICAQSDGAPTRLGIYHETSQVHCVSLQDGAGQWSAHCEDAPRWASEADGKLLWLTASGAYCASATDGRLRWAVDLPDGFPLAHHPAKHPASGAPIGSTAPASSSAVVAAGRLIVHRPLVGLIGIDVETGAASWSFTPPAGRLVGGPLAMADELLVTTAAPDDVYRLSARSGALLARLPGAGHAERTPLAVNARQTLNVNAAGVVQLWDVTAGRPAWSRDVSAGDTAGADPDLLADSRQAVVFSAGHGLQCWEPGDGLLRWRRQFATDPRAATQSQVLAGHDERAVYAVWDQRLRAFDLNTGEPLWERLLGDRAITWQVQRQADVLVCWPKWAPGQSAFDVWLLSAEDGQPLQRLSFAAVADATRLTLAGDRLVVASPLRSWVLAGEPLSHDPLP